MTVLDPLDEAALIRVLTEPKNSIVRQYKELFSLDNAELVFTDDALHEVAQRTIERKSGARGLRSVVEELLIPIMYDIPSDPHHRPRDDRQGHGPRRQTAHRIRCGPPAL